MRKAKASVSQADLAFIGRLADNGRLQDFTGTVKAITCWRQGSFTIVRVLSKGAFGRTHEHVGVAKLDCGSDEANPQRGREIALARALKGDAVRDDEWR